MKAAEEAEPRAQPELVHGCPAGLHGECPDRHTGDDIDKSLPGTPSCRVLRVRQYGPRDRLLPCRGASGSAQLTHIRCLAGAWRDL